MPVRQRSPAKSQLQLLLLLLLLLLGNKAVAAQQLPRRYSWELQFALLPWLQRLLSAPCMTWTWLPSWVAPCFVQKSTLPSPVCKPSCSSSRSLPIAEQSCRQRRPARLSAQRRCLSLPVAPQDPATPQLPEQAQALLLLTVCQLLVLAWQPRTLLQLAAGTMPRVAVTAHGLQEAAGGVQKRLRQARHLASGTRQLLVHLLAAQASAGRM